MEIEKGGKGRLQAAWFSEADMGRYRGRLGVRATQFISMPKAPFRMFQYLSSHFEADDVRNNFVPESLVQLKRGIQENSRDSVTPFQLSDSALDPTE